MQVEKFYYDNRIVKNFAFATILWGVVGMLAGLYVALQLVFPALNITQYGSFGRLRPLHTNAVMALSLALIHRNEDLLVSAGFDGMVGFWDIRTMRNEPPHLVAKFKAHGGCGWGGG